jgi:hypothetical protein
MRSPSLLAHKLSAFCCVIAFAAGVVGVAGTAWACTPALCTHNGINWSCDCAPDMGGCCWEPDITDPGGFWYGCRRISTGACVAVGYQGP